MRYVNICIIYNYAGYILPSCNENRLIIFYCNFGHKELLLFHHSTVTLELSHRFDREKNCAVSGSVTECTKNWAPS
jgi:hypothetical protein